MPYFHTTCFRPSMHSGHNNGTLLHCLGSHPSGKVTLQGSGWAIVQHKGVVCAEWLPPFWLEAHAGCDAGMLTACKLGLAGSDASACTPSTSIASGAAAAGLAAHAFCAAGCAGALLKKPNMLCWPCLALLPACHSLLHFSACSSLLNLLLNSQNYTTHH